MDGLIEKVGMYAMEKKTINVDAVKENFSINHEQAENVIKQLETIGFLDKGDESGNLIQTYLAFSPHVPGILVFTALSFSVWISVFEIVTSERFICFDAATALIRSARS